MSRQEDLVGRDVLTFVHDDWREVVAARLQALTGPAPVRPPS
jgi:hypothetical protein